MENDSNSLFEPASQSAQSKIKIIGLGGAGANAVAALDLNDLGAVQLAVMNTDAQALANSPIAEKLLLGRSVTRGLGAGGEIDIGRLAAETDRDAIEEMLGDAELIIMVVGLGGGTGSAAAPILAEIAAKSDALVLAFVTMPFSFEGARRKHIAEESIGELRKRVHGLIPLPNDMLLQEGEEDASVLNAFSVADKWIGRGVHSLCAMLLKNGLINQDLGSLRSVFQARGGKTIFGTGVASGDDYVQRALDELFICPLLHMGDRPSQLDRILVNVIGGADLSIAKVNTVMTAVSKRFDSRDDIVFGACIDPRREQSLEICVLAKAELESGPAKPIKALSKDDSVETTMEGLGFETEISRGNRPPRVVHTSKLSRKAQALTDQDEFQFVDEQAQRGYFEKTDRNLYNEEDLDVPTYLRRGIKIKIKA